MKRAQHINDGAGKALCKISARTGEERENTSGNLQRMGGVDKVELIDIMFDADLGKSSLCLNCIRLYKETRYRHTDGSVYSYTYDRKSKTITIKENGRAIDAIEDINTSPIANTHFKQWVEFVLKGNVK